MDIRPNNAVFTASSFPDFNENYARIVEQGTAYAYQIQKLKPDDLMFRTQSHDKLENDSARGFSVTGGSLFISGCMAPITTKKQNNRAPRPFKAPLPKSKKPKNSEQQPNFMPLQGFGCTNIR